MTEYQSALVILDGYFNIDYKYKRLALDGLQPNCSLREFSLKTCSVFKQEIKGFNEKEYLSAFTEKHYDNLIKEYSKKGVRVVTEDDEEYPFRLYSIIDRPICLYCVGNFELLNSENSFAMVGSRKTIPSVLKLGEEFAKKLSNSGVTIVTGVAGGGDLSAIKGAYKSGNIICVLACGIDNANKEYTRDYINKILSCGGLIISEYPPRVVALPYFYPFRNRIIAGLSQGVLIMSGDYKSGTRYTLNYALDYGREVFAFPYSVGVASGETCNKIIKDGGYLVTDVLDISEVMGYNVSSSIDIELSSREKLVLASIKLGKTNVDELMSETGYKIFELIPTLTSLEIKNLIVKNGSGEYQAVK